MVKEQGECLARHRGSVRSVNDLTRKRQWFDGQMYSETHRRRMFSLWWTTNGISVLISNDNELGIDNLQWPRETVRVPIRPN